MSVYVVLILLIRVDVYIYMSNIRNMRIFGVTSGIDETGAIDGRERFIEWTQTKGRKT